MTGNASGSASDLDITVCVRQAQRASAVADGAAEGTAAQGAAGSYRQFRGDVSEGCVGVHFVTRISRHAHGNVGKGSF